MTEPTPTAPMQWSDHFLLGYPAMDRTHQDFVVCVAALQRAADADLPARLQAFADHAVAHFGQEEQWMAETDFPAAQCHADEHAAVLKSVREVQALLAERGDVAVVRQLVQALVDWFPGHADYLDASLSHWMAKRSHGGAPVVLRRGVASPAPN
jgi:hemerythrin